MILDRIEADWKGTQFAEQHGVRKKHRVEKCLFRTVVMLDKAENAGLVVWVEFRLVKRSRQGEMGGTLKTLFEIMCPRHLHVFWHCFFA